VTNAAGWLREWVAKRPAESATAAAGGLGLLLAVVLGGSNDSLETALIVLIAGLPAAVSYLTDLGRYGPGGRRLGHDLVREIDELALRAVRRARLGHTGWSDDLQAVEKLLAAEQKLRRVPGQNGGQSD
jgi:hypothetical protein